MAGGFSRRSFSTPVPAGGKVGASSLAGSGRRGGARPEEERICGGVARSWSERRRPDLAWWRGVWIHGRWRPFCSRAYSRARHRSAAKEPSERGFFNTASLCHPLPVIASLCRCAPARDAAMFLDDTRRGAVSPSRSDYRAVLDGVAQGLPEFGRVLRASGEFTVGEVLDGMLLRWLMPGVRVHNVYVGAVCDKGDLDGIVVRNTLVTYDRHNEKIGFWKTNCSELWESLHISGAPSPAPSSDTGPQADMSPAPAPSSLPEFDVGLITVDMSINVTYPNLKPHLHELAELIAKELDIDSHQVRVMNVTSQGNSTLIRWGIFPAESANAMSNATAMGIIYRLTQHHVQLPENLGSYQLLEWNVQPLSRRSWFQEHVVSILIGILLVILLTLSAVLVLLVWRKNFRGHVAYRPVDSVVPEQELQPL